MLPGKKYKPEDVLQIAWLRKWWIIIPFVVVALGTAIVANELPNRYRAQTLILVIPQQVPESYVRSVVTTRLEDRLQTISQQILSRTRLEPVIRDFNLYPRLRARGIMQDVIDQMLKDVRVNVVRGDAFSISYESDDPRLAMNVANKLAEGFMTESQSDRAVQVVNTADFLKTQLDDARRLLTETEQKLAEYQRRHGGELPTERDANLQALNNAQLQVQNLVESINRDRDRRYLLEKQLADLENQPQAAIVAPPSAAGEPVTVAGASAEAQLEYARKQLQALEMRLTPEHPDVKRQKRLITDLEKQAQAEALQKPLSPGALPDVPLSPEERQRRDKISGLRLEIEGLDRLVQSKQVDEQRLRGVIELYQARLEATPGRESDLTQLTRDYDIQRKTYDSLLAKYQDARVSANLENRQIGEQFKTLDTARMPEKPISPNRPLINLLGALAGIGLGVGLVALLEYRDSSFKTDDEVASVLSLPVLAVIPMIVTTDERRRARRRKVRVVIASTATIIVAAVFIAWRLNLVNRFLR